MFTGQLEKGYWKTGDMRMRVELLRGVEGTSKKKVNKHKGEMKKKKKGKTSKGSIVLLSVSSTVATITGNHKMAEMTYIK